MHEKDLRIGLLCDFYGRLLTPKQYEALSYYYDDDLSLSEIADQEGITRQGVRDSIKKGEALLLEMEEKLGLCEKFSKMESGLREIREAAEAIREHNGRGVVNGVMENQVRRILDAAERMNQDGI